jgi:DNA-directed RNA polymerase specialized sigma24 family protein
MPKADQSNMHQGSPTDNLVNEFISAVSNLLVPDEFKGTALYKFLIRFARQWHIAYVDLDEVIVESVKRGVEHIQQHGEPIRKPEAWLRRVGLNILRDKVDLIIKDERRSEHLKTLTQHARSPLVQSELLEQLEFLEEALGQLSPADQDLIRMKFLHRKSYEQIRRHYKLMAEGSSVPSPVPSVQTLRKRESRALQRLRESFFKLYEGDVNPSA